MISRSRSASIAGVAAAAVFGAAVALRASVAREFRDHFEGAGIGRRWTSTSSGDFSERRVDIVRDGRAGGRLRLRAATMGTNDETVKFLGVRTRDPVAAGPNLRISAEIDWNGQANGSYLSGDLVVSPHAVDGNPLAEKDWLRVGYVGVPPGQAARMIIAISVGGRIRTLYDDGWPHANRTGRAIGRQRVELRLRARALEVLENGVKRFAAELPGTPPERAFLYLQMSTHSNYPARELLFDDVEVDSEVAGG